MKHNVLSTAALVAMISVAATPLAAQMTDATTIRPILEATKANWIGVRNWEGQDLLYFTHLESWKCGLSEIRYGINGADADDIYEFELCADDEAAPSPISAEKLPYLAFEENSITSVTITLVYDDGAEQTETFERAAVQLP